MVLSHPYVAEIPSIWFDKWRCDDAEKIYQEKQCGGGCGGSAIVSEIAKARNHIKNSLNQDPSGAASPALVSRIETLEDENKDLRKITDDLRKHIQALENRMKAMEIAATGSTAAAKPTAAKKEEEEEEDDDFDPFASEDEEDSEEQQRIKEERLAAYADKKSKKPGPIAKSSILLDVKPWDDETDMKKLEECVRSIECDGLRWGASKFVPLAYGIKKLQILVVVEDDKVGTDFLEEEITAFEDYIQSVDVAAFNKI